MSVIKTTVKREGFEGILYSGDNSKEKIVIMMSGSNGGMHLTAQCAKFYHKNGIPSLALALFATKGTQPYLDRVPLEYITNAITFLKNKGYQKIGIDGMSKGSEIALLAASRFSDISCVIARVPSHFVSEGLKGKFKNKGPSGTSCWSYQKKEIPYAAYKVRTFNVKQMLLKEKELHIISFNKEKDVKEENLIPIENIKAPVLLLSSKQDSVWPSYESSLFMEKRFKEKNFAYPYKHVAYENMSHAMLVKLPFVYKLAFKAERKNPKACKQDRKDLKNELLNWVRNVW